MRRYSLFLALASLAPLGIHAQTIRIEAENAGIQGPTLHVVTPDASTPENPQRMGFSCAGYVTGFKKQDDRLVFKFLAKNPGIYLLNLGYSCNGNKGVTIEVNGETIDGTLHSTGGTEFADARIAKVELTAGANVLAIDRGWGYFDIDYMELTMAQPSEPPAKPISALSDPHGTPQAAALLAKLNDGYGSVTELGVYNDGDAQYMLDQTGFRPMIMGGDLIDYATTPLAHGTHPHEVERLIADARQGYTITMSWHWRPPLGVIDKVLPNGEDARWYKSFYTNATTFDVRVAMRDAASPERAALVKDIDLMAVQLKRLDAEGIPVLWRPLHEAQGGWFWWGAKGPEPFVWLWRFLYNRLVNVDDVHNLVWVFTSGDDPAWYPGDAFVDVIGIDAYPKDLHDLESGLWDLLQSQFAGCKPLAISEFGGVPDIPLMQRFGEFWAYAVSWQDELGPRKNNPEDLKRIVESEGSAKLSPRPVSQRDDPPARIPPRD
jgi:mannan endo-1,4-beta-mannosidase